MTKREISSVVASRLNIPQTECLAVVDEVMSVIKESLVGGESVFMRGLGTFEVKTRKARTARNIAKGTSITIPEHKVPVFKACKTLKDDVK